MKRYFVNDPEGYGFEEFDNPKERDEFAESCIQNYLQDCWDEQVTNVVVGEVTHQATQVDRRERPEEIDEEGCDGEGTYWDDDWLYTCNYKLLPIEP